MANSGKVVVVLRTVMRTSVGKGGAKTCLVCGLIVFLPAYMLSSSVLGNVTR